MRHMLIAVLVCFASAGLAAEERSILFIGNSLTMYNNLPQMFADLAKAGGQGDILTDGQLVGGASLEKHWKDGKALAKLRSRAWTWVVLQEQSTTTFKEPGSFTAHARLFIDAITAQKAKPVLYLTWAREGEMDTQERITAAYTTMGKDTGALVVPAGLAFKAYRDAHGDGSLFVDNRHPKAPGTYLAACCFYGALLGKDPAGLPGDAAKLSGDAAGELQCLAWEVVKR
jgi:hypothetical protein